MQEELYATTTDKSLSVEVADLLIKRALDEYKECSAEQRDCGASGKWKTKVENARPAVVDVAPPIVAPRTLPVATPRPLPIVAP